jgi:hypothetical protein
MSKKDFTSQMATMNMNQMKSDDGRFKKADAAIAQASTQRALNGQVLRKTFSLPSDEYSNFRLLRRLAADEDRLPSESELVRAGIIMLSGLTGPMLAIALDQVRHLTPGRKD